ncbi:MAG: hypothetical protein PHI59_04890 [Candidatus Omnitrophica bacterium]|nr:hypothetical protein [Candidatus Omnitrophota bacterium]
MILIFDPNPPYLSWCKAEGDKYSEGICPFDIGWFDKVAGEIGSIETIESIGYVLHHGGEIIKNPVEIISSGTIKNLEKCIKFFPEYNDITFKVVERFIKKVPGIKHILFCDTAFFVDLPQEISTYAVPYELQKRGIRRFGRQGLCHQWAWSKIKGLSGQSINRAISIYLGNNSTMAAIENGRPRETSVGFTNIEGIISATSCGDIDPTIIFQLHATGMPLKAINRVLSIESGFGAILDKKSEFLDILKSKKGSKEVALREIYCYNILKYSGAFVSILGGADALIFINEKIKDAVPLISNISRELAFLGVKFKENPGANKAIFDLTAKDSPVKIYCLRYNKWDILINLAKEA